MSPRDEQETRREWLGRLGRPVALDFALFPVESVYPRGEERTVAAGELATGTVAVGDALEAVGYSPVPVPVRVARVDRPVPLLRTVEQVASGEAGEALGLTLDHAAGATIVPGQCLAPPGRLRAATRIEGDVWVVPSTDLPCSQEEQRHLLAEIGAGRGLELYFHTRSVGARALSAWRPERGAEYRLAFELDAPVPLYDGARFGLRFEGLTFGAGFVMS